MNEDRNRGVTEARFGLTVLICLLVAMGYIVLLRLGSPNESPIEVRPEEAVARGAIAPLEPPLEPNEPQVLPIESQRETVPQMSQRPEIGPAPPHGAAAEPDRYRVVPATSIETQRR